MTRTPSTWLAAVWPDHDWRHSEFHHGCFHDVAVCPSVVARVTRHGEQPRRTAREREVLDVLEQVALPFAVPRPLSAEVTHDGRSGLLTTRVPGSPRPDPPWDDVAGWFATTLATFAEVSREAPWLDDLPAPRTWCGGVRWPELVRERLVPLLSPELRDQAIGIVDDVLEAETGVGLVHGDLGPHNLLWQRDEITGLIDFDHACAGDPAIDVATLVGCYGATRVAQIVDDELLRRAMTHRASLSLQLAAAAELLGDAELRDHALRNFAARSRAGTLYDP